MPMFVRANVAARASLKLRRVGKRTLEHLQSYPWRGNVRELQNVIERSVIVCETDELTVDESWLRAGRRIGGKNGTLPGTLLGHEKAMIEEALRASDGCVFGPTGADFIQSREGSSALCHRQALPGSSTRIGSSRSFSASDTRQPRERRPSDQPADDPPTSSGAPHFPPSPSAAFPPKPVAGTTR